MLRARINETVTLRMLEEEICRYAEQTLDIAGEALLERAHKIQKSVMCQ